MKKTQIKNINDVKAETTNREGNIYHVKALTDKDVMRKSRASLVELEPNSMAYGYHYHESNEEMFYIISGDALLETIDGEVSVKAGDFISFPLGEGGVHVIKNASEKEMLIYLDFSTTSEVEIAHLPHVNKMMIYSESTFTIVDRPTK